MAELDAVIDDDDSIEDVSLIDNPTDAKPDAPSDAADKGKDDAAAAEDKKAEGADEAKKETEADKPAADKSAEGDQKPVEDPAAAQAERARVARQEFQERQRTKQQVTERIDEHYGPKSQDQLVEEGLTPEDARFEAIRQEMAFDKQRAAISEMNAGMMSEAVNAISDFPVFNENSPEYDAEFTKEVEQAYKIAARLQVDEHGLITNAEIPLYDFYQRMNGIYSRGASKGNQNGQAEMAAMLGRTEDAGGSSSTSGGEESLEEMEERLGSQVIT